MEYLHLKTIHVASVTLSFTLFFLRGVWMLRGSPLVQARPVKLARDVIDTLLLGSAIMMAWQLGLNPLDTPWLGAKIVALLSYIVIGSVALKRGKTRNIRLAAWLLALLVFGYMVSVAMTHDPMPWQAL
ncbi:MAG TPA: SirB2 family protein [Sideroxyarcus sp.]|nr:SirB2 family protein [Sideroxyarcus sp.]